MIEGEKKFDPQEIERTRSQLPKAEAVLKVIREKIEKSSRGYYSIKVSLPEGRTEWKIDMDVVRMMGGGILRMYDILHQGELKQSEERHQIPEKSNASEIDIKM